MTQPFMQKTFSSGEWAPALNARVDLAKYFTAAELLENYYVDYRGGASSRPGTKYILQCLDNGPTKLVPFQASSTVGYILEFGQGTLRFYNNGAPVLETGKTITGATQASPCVISVVNDYEVGDIVYVTSIAGMTQLNQRYFRVNVATGTTVSLGDLNGTNIDSSGYSAYSSGGSIKRVYTIDSPYTAAQLDEVKYAQNVNIMVLTHPDVAPQLLTLISATNWTLNPVVIGPSIETPTGLNTAIFPNTAGDTHYSYTITAVDENGQESQAASPDTLSSKLDMKDTPGVSVTVTWNAVAGAFSYNIYKAELSYGAGVPSGAAHGYIGNATGTSFVDSNIPPDFSQTVPIVFNPFLGAGVVSTTITAGGSYTTRPQVAFSSPGSGGLTARGSTVMDLSSAVVVFPGAAYAVGDTLTFANGVVLSVDTVGGSGEITAVTIINRGSISGSIPANPVSQTSTSGSGIAATFTFTWKVKSITITSAGSGYSSAPTITFSAGAATATATLGTESSGNPSVPAFFQQRLVFGGQTEALQTFYMSQPGSLFNFNYSNPILPSDSISGTLSANQLNEIKNLLPLQTGLLMMTNAAGWLVNGGPTGSAVTPDNLVAHQQSFAGCNDLPLLTSNFDVLFVQAKGSVVRNLTYDFYTNSFKGTDITVLSSHLFFDHTLVDWCWAEEPFKLVWVVREDGQMLTMTFVKEQELIGWTHSTTNGSFKNVASITEEVDGALVDAVYTVVSRNINGVNVRYVERFAEKVTDNFSLAVCVDAAVVYSGAAATSFTGAEHLAGKTVTGVADGAVITPFVMPTTGFFTLPTAASTVIIGLAFTPALKTLALDLGEPTVQSKMKRIIGVTVRVKDTLGLTIGSDASNQVAMKDLVVGNVGGMTNQVVSGPVTGDAYTIIDPKWTVQGQYRIEQPKPWPSQILGVIPEITVEGQKA